MIRIAKLVLDEVKAHAREARPRECCGMLIGAGAAVTSAYRSANLAADARRFHIDPYDHIAAIRRARACRLDVVGFYHSHPYSRPYPSESDVAEAGYAGAMHLIVGVEDDSSESVRLFTIDGSTIEELTFAVDP